MDIVVASRHTQIPERFREFASSKLAKVAQYDSQAQLVQVEVVHENNPRMAEVAETVEITVRGKGPVVRAEASAGDIFSAFDVAMGKLMQQERRAKDRRKSKHKMTRRQAQAFDQGLFAQDSGKTDAPARLAPPEVSEAEILPPAAATPAPAAGPAASGEPAAGSAAGSAAGASGAGASGAGASGAPAPRVTESVLADSPVVIREKVHQAEPMTVEQAIYEMELVGHPFFLFVDAHSGLPSVLYHRHGWTYGVLRLETTPAAQTAA
ncbi:MAG: ribosome-associated translation inhibitor RaiA [Bifidobacteriaceae bacterium]|jgi:ribosomal subunit interface protein|nr:ribosome-associated translation inhibitor RaiA [Bifidobacteriaceae bacterium]